MLRFAGRLQSQGLTLVEMLIVLVILGIMTTLAVPPFSELLGRHRLAASVNDLHAAILLARSEAVKRGIVVALRPVQGNWANGWTVATDPDADGRLDAGEVVLLQHEALATTTRVTADTTPGYIAFGLDGESRRNNGGFLAATLTLCEGGKTSSLILARGGRVRLAKGTC
jgi:type IV fimbrial biogenesis protein FimT